MRSDFPSSVSVSQASFLICLLVTCQNLYPFLRFPYPRSRRSSRCQAGPGEGEELVGCDSFHEHVSGQLLIAYFAVVHVAFSHPAGGSTTGDTAPTFEEGIWKEQVFHVTYEVDDRSL